MGHTARRREHRERLLQNDPRCAYCKKTLTLATSTLDHRVPLAQGGGSVKDNLVLACYECNALKADGDEHYLHFVRSYAERTGRLPL